MLLLALFCGLILQISKLKPEMVKQCAQGHTGVGVGRLNPALPDCKPQALGTSALLLRTSSLVAPDEMLCHDHRCVGTGPLHMRVFLGNVGLFDLWCHEL